MRLEEYGGLFEGALLRVRVAVPEERPLFRVAAEVMEMAAAYLSDGVTFLEAGDRVNALAAFAYGLGWLDAGSSLGLIEPYDPHPPEAVDARILPSQTARLDEKTRRYRRMLDSALAAVKEAPDVSSPLHAAAREFLWVAQRWYEGGGERLDAGDLNGALLRLSYGYAWLDAGIRAGLFRVTGRRDLFTV